MTNLIQTNIVGVFSVIDLLTVEKAISELFSIKKDETDNIESAKAPNLLGFFNNKEKTGIIITNNKLRADNNSGDEKKIGFIDDFFKAYKIIKKRNNIQNIAYGFNFTYSITTDEGKNISKIIKNKFIKPKILKPDLNMLFKGAGVRLMFENDNIEYDFRFDPSAPNSNVIMIQVNANHVGDFPTEPVVKKSYIQDLKFVRKIIEESKIEE